MKERCSHTSFSTTPLGIRQHYVYNLENDLVWGYETECTCSASPICIVLTWCAHAICRHCNMKLSLYYWTHWSCWWNYHFKKTDLTRFFVINPETQVDWIKQIWVKKTQWEPWSQAEKCLWYRNLNRTIEDLLPCYCYAIKTNSMGVRRNFSRSRHFAYLFQVVDDALQVDVYKTLYPFYTTKKMPYVMAIITKNTLRWQQ